MVKKIEKKRRTCPKCGYVAEMGELTACACGWRKGQRKETMKDDIEELDTDKK